MKKIENYINGNNNSISKKNLPIHDPSTGEQIAKVVLSEVEDFKIAIESSKKSQIELLKNNGIKTMCFATTLSIAKKMISYGIDSLVLEGNEAGGHIGPVSINVLVQDILPFINEVPVFVAGGIGRGEVILKFLQLGEIADIFFFFLDFLSMESTFLNYDH